MDFLNFCHAAGLMPKDIEPDGRWHRCATESHPRSRNGAFKLQPDGRVGFAQDWGVHPEPLTWHADDDVSLPPVDHAAIARRRAEEKQRAADAVRAAYNFFRDCLPLRNGHPYLTSKGLDMAGCSGLKVDSDGWLCVAMRINGAFATLQRISPEGEKRFWLGASTRSACHVIERRDAAITVLCEGLATGIGIFAAVPTTRVVVAFNAGNLVRVAEKLPKRGMAVVASDNDHGTQAKTGINPGVEAASEAAAVLGCGVAIPEGIAGTDWLDYRNERIADRLQFRSRREPESGIRRAVDAQIAAAMMRNANFIKVHHE